MRLRWATALSVQRGDGTLKSVGGRGNPSRTISKVSPHFARKRKRLSTHRLGRQSSADDPKTTADQHGIQGEKEEESDQAAGACRVGAKPALRGRRCVSVIDRPHVMRSSNATVYFVSFVVEYLRHFAYLMSSIQIRPFDPIFSLTVSTTKRIDWTFDSTGVELVVEPSGLHSSKKT